MKKTLPILFTLLFFLQTFTSCSKEIPFLADIDLVGWYHRQPYDWNAERFAPHVSFTDDSGTERWLFESFLFIESQDVENKRILTVSPGGQSGDRASWECQLERWLGPEGGVAELEKACAAVAARIGKPDHKRRVVITIPDPVMFEYFADKQSSTRYWGELNGREVDFADVSDQIAVCKWYIDKARGLFAKLGCKYLQLGGFYILSEELHLPFGETPVERLNCQYKRWEQIIPAVAQYCHDKKQGLYWIPYHLAPGYKHWKELGFDQAWMQPNWYWDLHNSGQHPFESTIEAIRKYDMGMETEFEFSMVADEMARVKQGPDGAGRLVFTQADVPALRERFRDYLRKFKDAGFYGERSIAVYTGTDALTQLARSKDPDDRAMYVEFCNFILGNPLRNTDSGGNRQLYSIAADGTLSSLLNPASGWDYAGCEGLWRLYYNTHGEKEIQILASEQTPRVHSENGITHIDYEGLASRGHMLAFNLYLTVSQDECGQIRFGARLENNEPGTIIRELHYPLVSNIHLPEGAKLLTTQMGGHLYDDPLSKIVNVSQNEIYVKTDQKFRQMDLQYPRLASANCYAFVGEESGLYFGSHDSSFQQTWHGIRAYPSAPDRFDRMEAGFYRYPNTFCGESWSNDASVLVPYEGDWTRTSKIYRAWVDTWWEKIPEPEWVRAMTGWQRTIFKHQYGEYLHRYEDLPGRVFEAGDKAGNDAVLLFGWWKEGMDNGYPDYTPDDAQGGDEALAASIAEYRAKGGHLILYYNGRLIDNQSRWYRSGEGSRVSNKDNTGDEFTEHYKFAGEGTTLSYYDTRTFVVADMSRREWRDKLVGWADRAMGMGANAVFYDQLGSAEQYPNWDRSREYPVQDIHTVRYKMDALREIRDHVRAKDPQFGIGTEHLVDATAQYCDFVHIIASTALPESFPEWFSYTFPEVSWSDRCIRDGVDVERRVNITLLMGQLNDIEIWRCRGLIDDIPSYQEYLGKVNAIRKKYADTILEGRFAWHDDFSFKGEGVRATEFAGYGKIAILLTTAEAKGAAAKLDVPGFSYEECSTIGDASVSASGRSVRLAQNAVAVLIFKKQDR